MNKKTILTVFYLFFMLSIGICQHDSYVSIDAYARSVPRNAERSIQTLAAYLQKPAKTDWEKARAIYIWLTDNIRYNDDGYNSGDYGDNSAEQVLRKKKAVCEGYSNLYLELGKEMGLDIRKIIGYAKGYSYRPGMKFKDTNHAWNIIKIEDKSYIFDATWGAGGGIRNKGRMKNVKDFDPLWFAIPPQAAIFSHLPEHDSDQLLEKPISKQTFERMPEDDSPYWNLGFDSNSIFQKVIADSTLLLPDALDADVVAKCIRAPAFKNLKRNRPEVFEFEASEVYEFALFTGSGKPEFFTKSGNRFSLKYTPSKSGRLDISVKTAAGSSKYEVLLIYQVVP